jgi:hypothetical protein
VNPIPDFTYLDGMTTIYLENSCPLACWRLFHESPAVDSQSHPLPTPTEVDMNMGRLVGLLSCVDDKLKFTIAHHRRHEALAGHGITNETIGQADTDTIDNERTLLLRCELQRRVVP